MKDVGVKLSADFKISYPWQNDLQQWISTVLNKSCMPHAILLEGNLDLGVDDWVSNLVRLILCESESKPCMQCTSCTLLTKNCHPDFLSCDGREETIKVDEIRNINYKLSLRPQQGRAQVLYIRSAETMTESAVNAILKTVEEPSGRVYFLIHTRLPALCKKTLVSRCQKVEFRQPLTNELSEWLASIDADLLLHADFLRFRWLFQHRPLVLLECLQKQNSMVLELPMDLLLSMQGEGLLPHEYSKKYSDLDIETILDCYLLLLHKIMTRSSGMPEAVGLLNNNEIKVIQNIVQVRPGLWLNRAISAYYQLRRRWESGRLRNKQSILEWLLLPWLMDCSNIAFPFYDLDEY
jgi:hypothetical protein